MHTRLARSNSINLKIERLLSDYLFKHGRLTLPGIGVIRHDGVGEVEFDEQSGLHRFSTGSLGFESDPKTELDDELVMHISQETGKMKSLAASDLESFIHFGQELINISKPFHLKGLGVIQKTASQQVEFIQEDISTPSHDGARRIGNETWRQGPSSPTTHVADDRRGFKMPVNLMWGLGLLLVMFGGYSIFRRIVTAKDILSSGTENRNGIMPNVPVGDSIGKASTSAVKTAPENIGVFNIVIEDAYRERALRRYADLKEWGHDIRMSTKDSLRFKMYIPVDAPLADTARHRDSLRIFFGRPVRVETKVNE